MSKSVFLKVSSAFLVGGHIATVGEIVEVSEAEAKDLLQRGKASLATAHDAPEQTGDEAEQNADSAEQTGDEAEQPGEQADAAATDAEETATAADPKPAKQSKKGK
jgi:hypothetical protein